MAASEANTSLGQRSSLYSTEKSKEAQIYITTPLSPASCHSSQDQTLPLRSEYPSGIRLWLILIDLTLVVILGGLDFSIVGVAVPAITENFHTIADVGWYAISYRLTACVFQFVWGQAYTIFSVRQALSTAIVIFLVGSAVSAAATSSAMFIIGRALTGVAVAGVLGGVFSGLMVAAPLRLRPVLTSVLGALESIAMVTGPIIGGLLTQSVSWRWCFYINLPIGGLALACLITFLPNSPPSATQKESLTWKQILVKLDLISNILLVISLTCLFMALSWAGSRFPWSSASIICLLTAFAASLCIFVFAQYKRGDAATLPPRILKQRSVIAGIIFSFCLNGSLNLLEYFIPIYFQAVREWTPASAGYIMLPVTIGFSIGLLIQGLCTTWVGYYTPFMILSSLIMPIGAGLMTTWSMSTNLAHEILYTGMIGFGSGLAFEVPQIAVQTVLSESDSALGLSMTLFAQNFGGAVFISVAQQVFTSQLLTNLEGKIPNLDATVIERLGFGDLSGISTNGSSSEVLDGMEKSFVHTWYISVALACAMMVGSLMMEWRSVKGETEDSGP